MFSPRITACNPHSSLSRRRSSLEEAYLPRARDMFHAKFCIFDFLRRDKRIPHASLKLSAHRIIDSFILISENDWPQAHIVINILIAIQIPDMRPLAMIDIDRGHSFDVRFRPFTVKLASGKNCILCGLPQFFRLFQASLVDFHRNIPPHTPNHSSHYIIYTIIPIARLPPPMIFAVLHCE